MKSNLYVLSFIEAAAANLKLLFLFSHSVAKRDVSLTIHVYDVALRG